MALLDDAIEAHGGRGRWRKVGEISAHVRSGGLLMRMKGKASNYDDYGLTVDPEDSGQASSPTRPRGAPASSPATTYNCWPVTAQ